MYTASMSLRSAVAVFLILIGCARPQGVDTAVAQGVDAAPAESASVRASFEALHPGWQVEADPHIVLIVENPTAKPYQVNRFVATAPALAIEGTDEHGARIPLGPPPMPREFVATDFVTIAPGGSERFPVSAQLLAQLPEGHYHIVSRLIPSATLDVEMPLQP